MKIDCYLPAINLVLAIIFAGVSFIPFPAQSQQSYNTRVRFIQPTLEKEPENRGAPNDRQGAGTRGDCPNVNIPLTALIPLRQQNLNQKQEKPINASPNQISLGLTVNESPTFWFYFPYQPQEINSVKFVLLDEENNSVTQEPIPITISETPGIISVRLPSTTKPLEIGKYYHWYFLVDCKPQSRTDDLSVEGLVKRVEPNSAIMSRLKTSKPEELVVMYAQAGIWQDAISILGELRRKHPQDPRLAADWQDLLKSVDLSHIATQRITPCCHP
ncbi:DUF928 domain-containing protein [Nostoc sp. FACHB-110]|uniref:DUF928 domain-containing protein n=1 Tax=Nostoc sp. FACHB-110 TaxID=2692834 RepID=UPI001688AEAB|nr:DUF928 domain-containing protein [Nostoc sp. FACHB-110]MBD2438438.1 DUF928 domain-containing protein [Nostoc sp. FACHB-110]